MAPVHWDLLRSITNNSRCDTAVTALGGIRFKFAPLAPKEPWGWPGATH